MNQFREINPLIWVQNIKTLESLKGLQYIVIIIKTMDGILRVMKKQESLPAMLQTLSTHIYFQYGMNEEQKI